MNLYTGILPSTVEVAYVILHFWGVSVCVRWHKISLFSSAKWCRWAGVVFMRTLQISRWVAECWLEAASKRSTLAYLGYWGSWWFQAGSVPGVMLMVQLVLVQSFRDKEVPILQRHRVQDVFVTTISEVLLHTNREDMSMFLRFRFVGDWPWIAFTFGFVVRNKDSLCYLSRALCCNAGVSNHAGQWGRAGAYAYELHIQVQDGELLWVNYHHAVFEGFSFLYTDVSVWVLSSSG